MFTIPAEGEKAVDEKAVDVTDAAAEAPVAAAEEEQAAAPAAA